MLSVLKTRDYRLLWAGQSISVLGDQFHLIALPWLVLTVTHDPVQLGIVLALAGVPRALLMLLGGAFADRHSPRTIMLVSDTARLVIVGALAVVVLAGAVQLWMIYVLAISFGIVSGFFMPAAQAAVPRLLPAEKLEGGNALMMGASQLMTFIGPAAAGTVIAILTAPGMSGTAALRGVGVAFVVDAISFAVSAACLLLMRSLPAMGAGSDGHPLAAVMEGLRYSWGRAPFRWMIGMIAVANFCVAGPLAVGLPVLAKAGVFAEGAAALGMILSAYGIGNLVGMVGAGSLPKPTAGAFAFIVVALLTVFGGVIALLGYITSTALAVALMVVLGLGNGWVAVTAISTLQRFTAKEMLGRVMSLLVLAMVGLVPVSQALAGFRHKSWRLDGLDESGADLEPSLAEAA
jgi:MFS family permease